MTKDNFPQLYKAFGLNIQSQIPISGFIPVNSVQQADVMIETGTVPESLSVVSNRGVLYQANETEYLMHLNGIGSFYVNRGNKIIISKNKLAGWKDINVFLVGRVFGALLHQRRLLTLHGSTLKYNGKILVFAGHSGSGKSTLAAALIDRGAELLSDDISAINTIGNKPMIIPSFPVIKLWEDSLLSLGKNPADFQFIRDGYRKYYVPVARFLEQPQVPDHIVILGSHNQEKFESKPLSGIEKFNALKNHTYFIRGINHTGIETAHFGLCNALAQQTPITRINRPGGPIKMGQLITCIESLNEPL
jgi:hypothetical protein